MAAAASLSLRRACIVLLIFLGHQQMVLGRLGSLNRRQQPSGGPSCITHACAACFAPPPHLPGPSPAPPLPPLQINLQALEPRLLRMGCKIVDFGNACWTQQHFTEDIQTRPYRAPEVGQGGWLRRSWPMTCEHGRAGGAAGGHHGLRMPCTPAAAVRTPCPHNALAPSLTVLPLPASFSPAPPVMAGSRCR